MALVVAELLSTVAAKVANQTDFLEHWVRKLDVEVAEEGFQGSFVAEVPVVVVEGG